MRNIYSMTQRDLESFFVSIGEKKFKAIQVFEWLYRKRINSFDEMTNIKKELRDKLKESFYLTDLKEVIKQVSSDGTIKFLFELNDGNRIETVLMRHEYGNSVCVTTQVGCNIGCAFCASGKLKKMRDLEAGEIVAQVLQVQKELDNTNERLSHIVIMGIGEPFDNYKNMMDFIHIVNNPKGLEIGARHITVSTSGLVPQIKQFAHEGIQVNLAISLHAPNNEKRNQLMKINKVYPIEQLIDACKYYFDITSRRLTFEYIILNGVNDSKQDAIELAKLLKGLNAYVNIIPYNDVTDNVFKRSNKTNVLAFYDILKKNNINATIRREKGHDIDAACGQLRANNE